MDAHDDTIDKGPKPIEELIKLQLGPKPEQCMQLSRDLTNKKYRHIAEVLQRIMDLFAWQPSNMPSIHPNIICHKLVISPQAKPVSQKKRKMVEELRKMIREEIDKLLKGQFIRKVKYSTWLANVVMVKKANRKWRMCTNYTNLNKACPKDAYSLPSINKLVDGGFDFQLLSFLGAYSGYNQIRMHP